MNWDKKYDFSQDQTFLKRYPAKIGIYKGNDKKYGFPHGEMNFFPIFRRKTAIYIYINTILSSMGQKYRLVISLRK